MKVSIVVADDWEGLYIDDKLVFEGHRIDVRTFSENVGVDVKFMEADIDWLARRGRLTEKLDDVVVAPWG